MYAKIKSNGQLQTAPNPLRIVVSNPTDAQYREWGWLPVVHTEPPIYDPETQYIIYHYIEDENTIRQVWEVLEFSDEETMI